MLAALLALPCMCDRLLITTILTFAFRFSDFITAFSKLDNVFRASQDVLKATGLMATIIWVGCGALFYIFEQSNPNWQECDGSIPSHNEDGNGCFDFATTASCNDFYGEEMCRQTAFINMPDSLYYTAVFLVGRWGLVDFTVRILDICMILTSSNLLLFTYQRIFPFDWCLFHRSGLGD